MPHLLEFAGLGECLGGCVKSATYSQYIKVPRYSKVLIRFGRKPSDQVQYTVSVEHDFEANECSA